MAHWDVKATIIFFIKFHLLVFGLTLQPERSRICDLLSNFLVSVNLIIIHHYFCKVTFMRAEQVRGHVSTNTRSLSFEDFSPPISISLCRHKRAHLSTVLLTDNKGLWVLKRNSLCRYWVFISLKTLGIKFRALCILEMYSYIELFSWPSNYFI